MENPTHLEPLIEKENYKWIQLIAPEHPNYIRQTDIILASDGLVGRFDRDGDAMLISFYRTDPLKAETAERFHITLDNQNERAILTPVLASEAISDDLVSIYSTCRSLLLENYIRHTMTHLEKSG